MSHPSPTEDFRLEVIPDLTPATPRAAELAELYLTSMGTMQGYDPELISDQLENMKGATFVTLIDQDERVVAMGGLVQPLSSTEGMVIDVATNPELRKKGLATRVIDELVRLAMREDLTRLSVIPSSHVVGEFYAHRGFDKTKSPMLQIKHL